MLREEPVVMPKLKAAKPFEISKQVVWEAYEKVKANKGAAGVDGESIEEFEEDLKGNLYKLWNRMSSGTYFPPPVRAVVFGAGRGADVPSRLLRLPAGAVCARRSGDMPEAVLEDGLGDRPRHPVLLRLHSTLPHAQGGVEAYGPALGRPLHREVARCPSPKGGRHPGATRPGDPTGFCDLAPTG